jgi:hypothetical protein
MSDTIEHDGRTYIERGYLEMANNTAKRLRKELTELRTALAAKDREAEGLREQFTQAQCFKDYVLKRLEDAGLAVEHESVDKHLGCRIDALLSPPAPAAESRQWPDADYRDCIELAGEIATDIECYEGDDLMGEIIPHLKPVIGEVLWLRKQVTAAEPASAETCRCEACRAKLPPDHIERRIKIMVVCAICGNKRCPHAWDHRYQCDGSNEPGQIPKLADLAPHRSEEKP